MTERHSGRKFIDRYRPTATAKDITSIDFSPFIARGVNTLLLDAEGTFVQYKGRQVADNIKTHIAKQRLAGISNIAIITNRIAKDEASKAKLNGWASQIGADAVFSPQKWSELKPAPDMLLKALAHFNIKPEQALFVGDKLTVDIKAANAAGISSVWIENHLGDTDILFDRAIRRRVEKGLMRRLQKIHPEKPDQKSIPDKTKFDQFMAEHGRTIADALSWSRFAIGPLVAGLVLTNHTRLAKPIFIAGVLTDTVDGKAARKSAEGGSRSGGKLDPLADKVLVNSVEAALAIKRRIKPIHPIIRATRDIVVTRGRKKYDAMGIDTKAGWPTKASSAFQFVADYYALTDHSQKNKKLNSAIQWIATAGKVAGGIANFRMWEKRKREKNISDEIKGKLPPEVAKPDLVSPRGIEPPSYP